MFQQTDPENFSFQGRNPSKSNQKSVTRVDIMQQKWKQCEQKKEALKKVL